MSIWDPKETLDSIGLGKRNEVKRSTRVADAIRVELTLLLHEKVRNPKLQDVSISRVTVTDDLRIAKIFFTIFGEHKPIKTAEKALNSAKGFMRSHVAKTLNMRFTPELQFHYDETAVKVEEMENLFQELAEERKSRGEDSE